MVHHVMCIIAVVMIWLPCMDGIFSGVEGCQDNCEKPDRLQVTLVQHTTSLTYLTYRRVA
jgi:hypothetical protein